MQRLIAKRALVSGTALMAIVCGWTSTAAAQAAPQDDAAIAQTAEEAAAAEALRAGDILVTGSRIRQDPNNSALPLQIITIQDLARDGISSPEQLIMSLSANGNAGDNLASNADVVTGQQRGNNGASFANLRGQGSAGTLVLLNGRRVAAHGLNGGAVDVNQIPFAALQRIEVLKDGASAIYGTDAIGGVINFITRTDFEGVGLNAFYDITERGDAPIYRLSAIAGYGDLAEQGFNVMAVVGYADAAQLRGNQRDFVNTFQPDRGLSVDTRGTPFATFIPLAGTAYTNANAPLIPGDALNRRYNGGINLLDLPGAAGCGAVDGQAAYDPVLWAFPQAAFACAWDTGRAAVLQQPLETLTYFGRAVVRLGEHELSAEVNGSDATAIKRFSNLQLTPNTTTQNYAYRRIVGVNDTIFDALATQLVGAFPSFAGPLAATPALSYRWRCIECGEREITTNTETQRFAIGLEGPLFGGWDYRVGASRSQSESASRLGSGYYYRGTTDEVRGVVNGVNNVLIIPSQQDTRAPTAPGATQPGLIGVLNSGVLNPFLFPGQTQSAQALAMLQAVSAEGVVLFGGRYRVTQVDASFSGNLFELPGGAVQAAVGFDYRRESYRFNGDLRDASRFAGDARAPLTRPTIAAAPFDDGNQLAGAQRDIRAAYVEVLIPVFTGFEITAAARIDDYSDFGSTTNPKIAAMFRPVDWLMFRGSYNTGFRAPSFSQIFNGQAESPYSGRDIADPVRCPGGIPNSTDPNCAVLTNLNIINGGRLDLRPETADQASLGVVFQPSNNFSLSLDWWMINRKDVIQVLGLRQLIDNVALFPDRFVRDTGGNLRAIDQTWINLGSTRSQGIEVAMRGAFDLGAGRVSAGLDGTYLLRRDERLLDSQPYGASRIGVFTFSGDLALRWKHTAYISYAMEDWSFSLSQTYRHSYLNQQLPGVLNGSVNPPNDVVRVGNYITYNTSIAFTGIEGVQMSFGIRNLFDRDPPFAVTYDSNTGSGSSWEPRVADPRGRSYTFSIETRF